MPNQQVLSDKIIFLNRSDEGRRPTKQSMCGGCKEKVLLALLTNPDTLINPDTYLGILKLRLAFLLLLKFDAVSGSHL